MGLVSVSATIGLLVSIWPLGASTQYIHCASHIVNGYECRPSLSHHWGQYSPYFGVKSDIPDTLPEQCKITFAQILMRHGSRYPTSSKTPSYVQTIEQIQANTTSYADKYAFLQNFTYNLSTDNLTGFGQMELVNAGIKYYKRYQHLARHTIPFIRASGEARVIESAMNFSQGYHNSKLQDPHATHKSHPYPYGILIIPEGNGINNTLNADLCTAFETGPESLTGGDAQTTFNNIWVPAVQDQLNRNLPGANLSLTQTINMMDLCTFETVGSPTGEISPFCHLFSVDQWIHYNYYQSLGKYYGYGSGNPLGPTQGVGFTNELIARMLTRPVHDHTSVNHTLDSSEQTFPLGRTLYADFSHDNDLTGIFSAMGLYNTTAPLSNTTIQGTNATMGYSAAWTVPFAAAAYFEKMRCGGAEEELVRVIVNDRVIPLQHCGADSLGRCKLSKWVHSLSFARSGGLWHECFTS